MTGSLGTLPLPLLEGALLTGLCATLALVVAKDIAERRIPDGANLALALLGLGHVLASDAARVPERLVDAAVVGLLALALRAAHRRLRKVTGLGLGDVKFMTAATIWTGLSGATLVLLVAALAALAFVAFARLSGRPVTRRTRIPFGPFLAAGLLCVVILDAAGAGPGGTGPLG